MAVLQQAEPTIVVLSLDCADNAYPSIGRVHAPAIRLERVMRDLIGLDPIGLAGHAALVRSRPMG